MGNKKKLIQKGLINFFPEKIHTFVDLFSGSAIVSMNTKAENYILNDKNLKLVEFYNLFKELSSEEIIKKILYNIQHFGMLRSGVKQNTPESKEYKQKYELMRKYANQTKNTIDIYTCVFYAFSQQMRFNKSGEFNMPFGNGAFTKNCEQYISDGCNFFSKDNVHICNKDFAELKPNKLKNNDFVYLDPPYMNTTATYNENGGWSEKDGLRLHDLCEQLNKQQIKFALSNIFSNKGIENKQLIDWVKKNKFNVHYFNDFNYMACGKGNANTVEVLITDY